MYQVVRSAASVPVSVVESAAIGGYGLLATRRDTIYRLTLEWRMGAVWVVVRWLVRR